MSIALGRRRAGTTRNGTPEDGTPAETQDEAAPLASRFSLPRMKDARWIIGVVLLILGVLGTLRVVAALDDSIPLWAAKRPLAPGQRVSAADFVRTEARIPNAERFYLPGSTPPVGIIQRPVAAGELLPRTSVGAAGTVDVRPVSIMVARGQADIVRAGADVEVWIATKKAANGATGFEKPVMVVDRATVSHVGARSGGVVAMSDASPVEVLVPRAQLADVIDAVNSDARVTLVPTASGGAA